MGDTAHTGALTGDSLLLAGGAVPDEEVQRRCAATHPDGTAYILYTSGTTGFPKGVMQSHYAIRNVMDEANRMGITPNDVTAELSTALPCFWCLRIRADVADHRISPGAHGDVRPGRGAAADRGRMGDAAPWGSTRISNSSSSTRRVRNET